MQHVLGGLGVAHQHTFGQFELQIVRIPARFIQRCTNILEKLLGAKLDRRGIDRHDNGGQTCLPPGLRLAASFAQYPAAKLKNQTTIFGNRNELCGEQQAPVRMLPTDERFNPHHQTAFKIYFWLVVQDKFLSLQRAT